MANQFMAAPYKLSYTKKNYNESSGLNQYQVGSMDYTVFGQEYFSGANVNIYFNNVMIDEVVAMQLTMQEQHLPVYGYGSYTYDAMAKGNRIISGTFGIYYKEEAYLFTVMDYIDRGLTNPNAPKGKVDILNVAPEDMTIEALLNAKGNKNQKLYDDLANAYEKALWGDALTTEKEEIQNRGSDSYFAPYAKPNIRKDGFKIVIVFGPEAVKNLKSTTLPNNMSQIPTTMRTIHGVHITGSRMVISASGDPIYEEYDFLAKDFDNKN